MEQAQHILSLAIPVRNSEDSLALKATLDSIPKRDGDQPIEVRIQVGQDVQASFDSALLKHPCAPIWRFEKDTGIYSAMNAMCRAARGSRILFLGAGDCLLPGLTHAIRRWSEAPVPNRLELGGVRLPHAEPRVPNHYPARWDRSLIWRNTTHHQGIAYPRQVLLDLGGFPEEHRILADYAINLRMWSRGVAAHWKADEDWVSASAGGVSRQFNKALYAEERAMKRQELKPGPARWAQPLWIGLKSIWKRAV